MCDTTKRKVSNLKMHNKYLYKTNKLRHVHKTQKIYTYMYANVSL